LQQYLKKLFNIIIYNLLEEILNYWDLIS